MKIQRLLPFLGCLFFGFFNSTAQEVGTHFMTDSWQRTHTNPAFVPDQKWTVALPGIYYHFSHQGGSWNDILVKNNGVTQIDFGNFIDQLDDSNDLHIGLQVPLLEIAYATDRLRLSLNYQTRLQTHVRYPKTFADLLWNGNAQYIGETVTFGPALDLLAYNALGLGAAYRLSENWTVGVAAKYLSGFGSIATDTHDAQLYTSDDVYQLTFETDYTIRSSSFLDINGLDDFSLDVQQEWGALFTQNQGLAFDIGVQGNVTDRLSINASLMDIGTIDWDDAKQFRSEGSTTYEGFDVGAYLLSDTVDFDLKLDTLKEIFAFQETATTFKTTLPRRMYLGANYQINEQIRLGAVYISEKNTYDTFQTYGLNMQAKLFKMLTLGFNYALRPNRKDTAGVWAVVTFGPVQLYGMTDSIFGVFRPQESTFVNGRIGLNLCFGK